MKPAAENMKIFLQKTDFKEPNLQLISNVTALPVEQVGDLKSCYTNKYFLK